MVINHNQYRGGNRVWSPVDSGTTNQPSLHPMKNKGQ